VKRANGFFILFAAQCVSYGLICWNYRAVAKGMIPQVVVSDLLFAALQFKVLKRVAAAESNLAWAGYVLGGAAGSALSVYLTKLAWGS
jgi:hypothetical protein